MVHTFVHIFYWRMIALTLNRRAYTDKRVHLNHSVFLRTQYKKLPISDLVCAFSRNHSDARAGVTSEKWSQPISCTQEASQPRTHITHDSYLSLSTVSLFRLALYISQVFPYFRAVVRIWSTWRCLLHSGATMFNRHWESLQGRHSERQVYWSGR